MKFETYSVEKDGFYGAYFPCKKQSDRCVIMMAGDNVDDYMAQRAAAWLNDNGINCMNMAPGKNDYSHHSYPLERFEAALQVLKKKGNTKFGIAGASTTGMLALIAASYFPEFTLTIAMTPSDFVMEGFYRDGKDGAEERPGDGESSVSCKGVDLPYLPYAWRHPQYWQRIVEDGKKGGDRYASRRLFDESERLHPLQEEELIKIENIKGHLLLIGAEDDVLWDTARYIRRMEERLKTHEHECTCEALVYERGTHYVFPESFMKKMFPFTNLLPRLSFAAGKKYPADCRATRLDIDRHVLKAFENW